MLYTGDGIPADQAWGLNGIEHAARARCPEAIAWLTAHRLKPVLDPAMYPSADAELDIARDLLFGLGQTKNPAAALKVFEAKADQGYPRSQFYLGRIYEEGLGVAKDLSQAFGCYYRAADVGDVAACYRLGKAYWDGEMNMGKNDQAGYELLDVAAEAGFGKASYLIGEAFANATHRFMCTKIRAAKYYAVAVGDGWPAAEAKLADMFYTGDGVAQDFDQAAKWARKAADGGQRSGVVLLAYLYRAGAGVPKDAAKSLMIMKAPAAAGDTRAQDEIAHGFEGTASGPNAGNPLWMAQRQAQAAALALSPLLERAYAISQIVIANNSTYSPAQIVALEKNAQNRDLAVALEIDSKKQAKALSKVDWHQLFLLGKAYVHGDGVPVNLERAETLLTAAYNYGKEPAAPEQAAWAAYLLDRAHKKAGTPKEKDQWEFKGWVDKADHETPSALTAYRLGVAETPFRSTADKLRA